MKKLDSPFEHYGVTAKRMSSGGVLLMSGSEGNPMTIGWAQLGVIWGKTILTVLVRPSRYSFGLMEGLDQFSVNVLPTTMRKQLGICGSKSGRDTDKIDLCDFNKIPGRQIVVPSLEEAELIYECRTVAKEKLLPEGLMDDAVKGCYPEGDYHTLYYGEVLGVYSKL